MTVTHLIAFNAALLAAIISPGPALLVAIQTTLRSGPRAGISVGIGLAVVASLWTLAALFGLEAAFALFPGAYWLVKTAGAVYLIYIAGRMWLGADSPVRPEKRHLRHAFARGLAINLLNPKSVLFAAAVLVVVFPPDMSARQNLLVVANHLCVEIAFYALLAFAMSREAVGNRYLAAKPVVDRISAAVLGFLGLRLLVSR